MFCILYQLSPSITNSHAHVHTHTHTCVVLADIDKEEEIVLRTKEDLITA